MNLQESEEQIEISPTFEIDTATASTPSSK
jgi:hypothetical protein